MVASLIKLPNVEKYTCHFLSILHDCLYIRVFYHKIKTFILQLMYAMVDRLQQFNIPIVTIGMLNMIEHYKTIIKSCSVCIIIFSTQL